MTSNDHIRPLLLFTLAGVAAIGGAWLVWQGVREHRGLPFIAAGIVALGGFRPDRYDLIGATICLAGVAVIMYPPAVEHPRTGG